MRGRATTATALALLGAGAAASATGSAAGATDQPVRKTVKVADNFYSPKRLTVPPKSTIVWKWSRRNGETHDVYLLRKPQGVKRFQSAPAATDYSFRRKLRRAGIYKLICTFHENMTMRVRVSR